MIFNTIIKGKGGITGEPIVVSELPTPTEKDVGKVYLWKNTKILPVVGEPIGDKIYFDTTKNPLDYSQGDLLITEGDIPIVLGYYDFFEIQNITGMGYCYVMAILTADMSVLYGVAYVYCDVLTVEQFNANVGSQFGISITEFGWQTDVIDTSAIANYVVAKNYLADYGYIAYLGTIDIDEVEDEYYVGKNSSLAVGEVLGYKIYFDTTQSPMDYIEGMTSIVPVFFAANEDETRGIMFIVGDVLNGEGGDMGQAYMIVAQIYNEGSQQISCPYVYCNVLTVDEFNTNLGSQMGLSITEFGWQMDEIDTSAVADCVVKENYISEFDNIAYGAFYFEKIHIDEITELAEENASLTTANETLTTEKTNLESQVSTLTSEKTSLETQVSALTTENSTLTSEKASLETQVSTLTTENSNLETQVSTLTGEKTALEAEYDNLIKGSLGNFVYDNSSSIRPWLFAQCMFSSLTLGDNVTTIGEGAFYRASLGSISLPSGLTSIGDYAFSCCSRLTSITIPAGVTSLPIGAFYGYRLPGNTWSASMNLETVLFAENSKLTSIDNSAFNGCEKLKNITIPDSVTTIGAAAFRNCTGLTSINIPAGVTRVSNDIFWGCSGLTSIELPSGITGIFSNAFQNCTGLTSLVLPDSVTSIGEAAFYGCSGLTSINIPDGVIYINKQTFYRCSSLTSLVLPDSVTSIGEAAFTNCTGLTSINIPDGVKKLLTNTFYNCSGLTSIELPSSITDIYDSVFANCKSLSTITINATTPPVIGRFVFNNCPINAIYVPAESVELYKAYFENHPEVLMQYLAEDIQAIPPTATVTVNYTVDGHDHGIMGDTAPETVAYGSDFAFQVDCEQGYAVDTSSIIVTGATLAYTQTVYEPDGVTVIPESLFLAFTDVTGDVTINMTLRQY